MKHIILATLVLFAGTSFAEGAEPVDRIANPLPEPWRDAKPATAAQQSAQQNSSDDLLNKLVEAFNKSFPPPPPNPADEPAWTEKDFRQMEESYEKLRNTPWTPGDFTACNGKPCPFEQAAKECGEKKQIECGPARLGKTMCGLAVAEMIKCMKPHLPGASAGCTGGCGHGKMFVDCQNGQMKQCGYEQIKPTTDNRCKMPGAVLAYSGEGSPTERGQEFGHVEFVCGQGRYCSVYKEVNSRPWPLPQAHGCWFPKAGGAQ